MHNSGAAADRDWNPLTIANAALMLALEAGMLAALCYWGFTTDRGWLVKIVLGLGAPVAAGTVWGLFLAAGGPTYPLPEALHIVVKLTVFGLAALALYASGHSSLGLVFAVLVLVSVTVERLTLTR